MYCIYCKEKVKKTKGKEHVMMRAFGKFGDDTPTLECVCDECNKFFGDTLDLIFTRNSLEGIFRYKNNIYSSEKRLQDKHYLKITLPRDEEFGDFGGIVVSIDGTNDSIGGVPSQVIFKDADNKDVPVLESELNNLDWKSEGYSIKNIRVIAESEKKHNNLVKKLYKMGIGYRINSTFKPNFIKKYKGKKIPLNIECLVDHKMKRAIAKILFNTCAKYIGYEEVIKSEWDIARDYIRFNRKPLKARRINGPFWGEETQQMRYQGGYSIKIENYKNDLLGGIQFFNLSLYEFILVENIILVNQKNLLLGLNQEKDQFLGKSIVLFLGQDIESQLLNS